MTDTSIAAAMLTIPPEIVQGLGIVIPRADLKVLDLSEEEALADTAAAVDPEVEEEAAAAAAAAVEVLLLDRTK
jgi:hypothetical protein